MRLFFLLHGKTFNNKNIADGIRKHATHYRIGCSYRLIKAHFPNGVHNIPGNKHDYPAHKIKRKLGLLLVKNTKRNDHS